MKSTSFLYRFLIEPTSASDDEKRQEFILNILLVSISGLLLILFSLVLLGNLLIPDLKGVSPWVVFIAFLAVSSLLYFSRNGNYRVSSYLLIFILFSYTFTANFLWGPDLPITWILYCLLIVLSGALISSDFSFLISVVIVSTIFVLTSFIGTEYYSPFLEWKQSPFLWGDALGAGGTFMVISIVSWLFSRDLEKSLARARASEAALQAERDQLEIKVEERTKQLKEAQESQLEQMTRFAEFGQLASGIMHDLANPLTSMSINLQLAKDQAPTGARDTAKFMDQALQATERMEELVQVARKQFRKRPDVVPFLLSDEIEQAVQLLQSKARPAHVRFDIEDIEQIETVGSPLKFHRVILNLLANAIEAYVESRIPQEKRQIRVTCHEVSGDAVIEVIDQAGGIPDAYLPKIFQPFFTTKANGSGIGLPTVKEILEKDFDASIQARNSGSGALFEIRLPIRKDRP